MNEKFLTPEDVANLQQLTNHASDLTNGIILPAIYQIWKDVDYRESFDRASAAQYSIFVGIEGDDVMCEGDEYWAYGGREHYSFSFPVSYLSDPDFEKIEITKRDEKLAEINEKKALKEAEAQAKQEIKDRAEFERLKEKFS